MEKKNNTHIIAFPASHDGDLSLVAVPNDRERAKAQ